MIGSDRMISVSFWCLGIFIVQAGGDRLWGCSARGLAGATCVTLNVGSQELLLMEEILHQLIGSLPHYLQGFIHPRWLLGISSNSGILGNWSESYLSVLKNWSETCKECAALAAWYKNSMVAWFLLSKMGAKAVFHFGIQRGSMA